MDRILIHRKNVIRIRNKDITTLLLVSEDVLGPTVDLQVSLHKCLQPPSLSCSQTAQ